MTPHAEISLQKRAFSNRQNYCIFAPAAAGVKLALENGQKRDYDNVLESLLAEFTGTHVGFCYDSGHEHV